MSSLTDIIQQLSEFGKWDNSASIERKQTSNAADLIDNTFTDIRSLLHVKGGEYALDTDRLANFRINGKHMGLPMTSIWRVYAGKHWDAINTYIKDERENKTRERSESIEGRINDLMTYCILLKLIINEKK